MAPIPAKMTKTTACLQRFWLQGIFFVLNIIAVNSYQPIFSFMVNQGKPKVPTTWNTVRAPLKIIHGQNLKGTNTPNTKIGDYFNQTPEENKILHLIKNADAKKSIIWSGFFLFLMLARPFYNVAIGTFILTYIGNSVVQCLLDTVNRLFGVVDDTNVRLVAQGREPLVKLRRLPRKTYAALYITGFLSTIVTAAVILVPNIKLESQTLTRILQRESPYLVSTEAICAAVGDEAMAKLEAFMLAICGSEGRLFAGFTEEAAQRLLNEALPGAALAPWTQERALQFSKLLQFSLKGQVKNIIAFAKSLLKKSTSLLYNGVVSLLFSSMIIYDYPNLRDNVRRLKHNSRLAYPYEILSPKLKALTKLIGQSFEVQTMIALCNTVLTTGGLYILGIPGALLMSVLVLVCSFIPLAGIFISTAPMVAVALTEYGLSKAAQVIAMVVVVHAVEAYLLNPQIYASKLKLHPIFVLASLYITEHVAGVQGLFLAVPVAVYIVNEILLAENGPQKHLQ